MSSIREHLDAYKLTFGGGMIPFDLAYSKEQRESGRTQAECELAGGNALLDAFVKFVEEREARA